MERLGRGLAIGVAAGLAVTALAGACGGGAPAATGTVAETAPASTVELPAPDREIPRSPARLAAALHETTKALRAAVDRWLADGNPSVGGPPHDVELYALYQQRIYRLLRRRPDVARRTIPLLPYSLVREARDNTLAGRGLGRITPALPVRPLKTGPPLPAGVLLRYYRKAERRFGVDWEVLAAVNFVESAFGKLRNDSAAGAQGPMQFIPATWRAYGLGGDVHDPHDAILGAANYLRASGAPGDYRRALYHYNPSPAYVDVVLRYTGQIRRDPRDYFIYYSWQVFVRTPAGDKRLTGPGRK